MAATRIEKIIGAVDIGSFRIAAMIAGLTADGELVVLGSGHRAADGIRRGGGVNWSASFPISTSNSSPSRTGRPSKRKPPTSPLRTGSSIPPRGFGRLAATVTSWMASRS